MKHFFSLLVALLSFVSLSAQTFVPTSADAMQEGGVTVTFAQGGGTTPPTWYANGLRLYAKNTITVSGGTLTSVQLVCTKQGGKPYASLSATPGTLTDGGTSTSGDDEKIDLWSGSASSVTFTLGDSGQRLIKRIIVNGDTTSVGGGGQTQDSIQGGGPTTSDLDPSYNYSEPTTIGVPSLSVSQKAYEFVENNVKVSCSTGAVYSSYFSCYAGQTITFTATQPIKALVADAFLKKDFSATASAGQIEYLDASEDTIVGSPALIVRNINATTVTITCAKQIRFYSVDLYFESVPEVELSTEGDDELYSYEWEPAEQSQFNLVMDSLFVLDMTENLGYKAVYMAFWNDDAELDMVVFADYAEATGVTPGTYPVSDSYDDGTVQASVGGDEEMDYESYLMTNYFEEDGEWYYEPYYIVSGSLQVTAEQITLDATSYYGSTIHMTYAISAETALETESAVREAVKILENGTIRIHRGQDRFSLLGQQF